MLHLIGLGLNLNSISKSGIEALKKCGKIFLENYTVDFPYNFEELEKIIGKKIIPADREMVESFNVLENAEKENIGLLVYGSPLTATTHISLLNEARKKGIKYEIIHNASILDAVAETGLQIYKFGKITSIPKHEAESFAEVIKDNLEIDAHTLILVDIGLETHDALIKLKKALEKYKIKIDKLILCSQLGTENSEIFYSKIKELEEKEIKKPFCIIIPGKLHFAEEEFLKELKNQS
ncbi:MAG: diphthine synthase [archaeon]